MHYAIGVPLQLICYMYDIEHYGNLVSKARDSAYLGLRLLITGASKLEKYGREGGEIGGSPISLLTSSQIIIIIIIVMCIEKLMSQNTFM